jgi:hypothetical protein
MGTKATFYRIKGGKNLRTDSMEGTFYDPPEVGEGFRYMAMDSVEVCVISIRVM